MSLQRKLNVKIVLMFIVAENTGSVNIWPYSDSWSQYRRWTKTEISFVQGSRCLIYMASAFCYHRRMPEDGSRKRMSKSKLFPSGLSPSLMFWNVEFDDLYTLSTPRHEFIFCDPEVVSELSRLHENFVIDPADKDSNNYRLSEKVWRQHLERKTWTWLAFL